MKRRLEIVILVAGPADAQLAERALEHAGLEANVRVVGDAHRFRACLSPDLDVILADYAVPCFGALDSLALLREQCVDVPCIVLSDSVGEEVAVECIKQGAADYLLKDRLTRLGPAVLQAVAAREARRTQRRAEQRNQELAQSIRLLLDAAGEGIYTIDAQGRCMFFNRAAAELTGYQPAEVIGHNVHCLLHHSRPDGSPTPRTSAPTSRRSGVGGPAASTTRCCGARTAATSSRITPRGPSWIRMAPSWVRW